MRNQCIAEDCGKFAHGQGYCDNHYRQWLRRERGLQKKGRKPRPVSERFWTRVQKTETCWLWTGGITPNGYGEVWINEARQNRSAHRTSYELTFGEIPNGLVIDHLCRVRHCVNPAHLEAVTQKVNIHRGLRYNPEL